MATKTNPTPETGTTVESASAEAPQAASAGKVRVRWTGATALKGVRQQRTIGKHTWISDGWDEGPVVEMDADAWAEMTSEQRKADGLEEA